MRSYPQLDINQNERQRGVFKMELFWVMYRLCGGSYRQTQPNGNKQVRKCIQICPGYMHSRLVSVARIFLSTAGLG